MPRCLENNIGILTYSSLQQGLLTGNFTAPEQVPEGRRRTRHFAGDSTTLSRHSGQGCETLTFDTLRALSESCSQHDDLPMARAAMWWLLSQPGVSCLLVGWAVAAEHTGGGAHWL